MRIAIDLRPLQTASRYRGIGTYLDELVRQMTRVEPQHNYIFLTRSGFPSPVVDLSGDCHPGFLPVPAPLRPRHLNWIWDSFQLPKLLAHHQVELFHHTSPFEFVTGYDPRRPAPFSTVATVYDLTPLHMPGETFGGKRILLRPLYYHMLKTLSGADLLLAISNFTALDIEQSLGVPAERLRVTMLAAGSAFRPPTPEEAAQVYNIYDLKRPFLLYVGGFNPNKNLSGLLEAMALLKQEHPECLLVVAGRRGPAEERWTAELVAGKGLEQSVRFLEFVPPEHLAGLYALCRAFVFPSFREGFGLPPLEAMACEAPVACSRSSSIPEVAGDAALYFEPYRIEEMAAVLSSLWKDEELRHRLSRAGREQATRFSWERCARETLQAYREAITAHRQNRKEQPG